MKRWKVEKPIEMQADGSPNVSMPDFFSRDKKTKPQSMGIGALVGIQVLSFTETASHYSVAFSSNVFRFHAAVLAAAS